MIAEAVPGVSTLATMADASAAVRILGSAGGPNISLSAFLSPEVRRCLAMVRG